MSLQDMIDSAIGKGADRLVLVNRRRGEPSEIRLLRLEAEETHVAYPIISLRKVKLRRDYGTKGRFVAEAVTAGERKADVELAGSLASFFDLPLRSDRGFFCSFHVTEDYSRRLVVNLTSPAATREVGPGFVVQHLAWHERRSERYEEHAR